jgi:hypothetical protein
MEGYRGGALGFKAASFHAIGANFRYLRDPEDNPWYPTARLLRQRTEGDWTSVIDLLQPKLN